MCQIFYSAGIGRTGTLIALDILLDQIAVEDAVDICECVKNLRHQRTQMVQTLVITFLINSINDTYFLREYSVYNINF